MNLLQGVTRAVESLADPLHCSLEMRQLFDIRCQEEVINGILGRNKLNQLHATHWYSRYYTKTFLGLEGKYLKSQESAFQKALNEITDKVIKNDELLQNFFTPKLDHNRETDYVLVSR